MRPSRSDVLKLSAELLNRQKTVCWKDLIELTDNVNEVYIIGQALNSLLKDDYIVGKDSKKGVIVTEITESGNEYIQSFL